MSNGSQHSQQHQQMFLELFDNQEEYTKYCTMFNNNGGAFQEHPTGKYPQQTMSYSQAIVSHDSSSSGTGTGSHGHCVSPVSGNGISKNCSGSVSGIEDRKSVV